MRNFHFATLVLALIGLVLITGCESQPISLEEMEIPFIGESVMADIEDDQYRFFRYENELTSQDAKADIAKVSEDGKTIDGEVMPWDGPVHFFQLSARIVIYVGSNPNTISAIENVFGRQVAGDPIEK